MCTSIALTCVLPWALRRRVFVQHLQYRGDARSWYTLHTAHCTLHTTHCTLHTAHYTLHTAHCTLHTACCSFECENAHIAIHLGQHCLKCTPLCNNTPQLTYCAHTSLMHAGMYYNLATCTVRICSTCARPLSLPSYPPSPSSPSP